MNNKGILLRAPHVKITPPQWVLVAGHALTTAEAPEIRVWRAALTWCYKAGEGADGDAWDLLVHTTQALLVGSPWPHNTSIRDAREVIGEVARRLVVMGEIPAPRL